MTESLGRRVFAVLLLSVLTIGFAAIPASAQTLYGSIVGAVKDPQGAAVPGATVTIVNKETNLTRDTVTDGEGAYRLVNVLAGPYDIKISLTGFREVLRSAVPISVGQIARIDVTLEVGTLTETITVASEAQLLQTDKADVHTELKSTDITNMPLNQFRNYQALVTLVPGSVPMRFQNAETDTPARSLATNVNGQAINNNATRTDGATNVNIWLPSHNMYVSPAETVDTVNISTNNFDAEQGMAGGAAITVVTKSGTNNFKGSAFEFHNNQKFNAKPFNFTTASTDKLPVERNIFGGTVGGPIKHNRMFFFGSYEGYKSTQSLFTQFSVPNAALRAGDFSGAVNTNGSVQTIYNPFTGGNNGQNRVAFDGNRIPSNLIDPIALRVLQLAPLPNIPGTGAGGLTNNYRREETRTTDRHNYDLKLNFNRTSAHQIWGKFSYMDAVVDDLTNYLGPSPTASGDGGFTKVYQFTVGQTWTLSPTMIMDSTFGFSRQDQQVFGPDFQDGNYGLDVLGIPGTNDPVNRDPRYAGYPVFNYGFSALGNRDGWNPIYRDERTYSFATNFTKVKGRHEMRFGYLGNYLYLDHWQPETGNPRGNLSFSSNTTALRGGAQAGNFYNTYAAFLLGAVGTPSKSVQNELMTGREWQHALFYRDRWNVSAKLTLDLGIRWEYYPIMTRANGRGLDVVDLNTLDVILGGLGGNPKDVGIKAGKDNFAPRLGAVYRLNENTVFRTGYGITYNPIPWSRVLRGDNQYPITIANSFNNPNNFEFFSTLAQGIPVFTGPDTSTGRVPLPNATTVYTPEVGNVDRGYIQSWNTAFERRLPWNVGLDVAYVGTHYSGGYAVLDINAPQVIGAGNQGRPYFSFGRVNALNSFGQRTKTNYQSLQLAVNRPFVGGLLLKGAYTLSRTKNFADEDGRVTLSWNTLSQYDRNYAPAGYDRKHNLQVGFAYALPWKNNGGYGSVLSALVSDWQLNGVFGAFSGTPFTVTANGGTLNTPSNTQTANLVGDVNHVGLIGAAGVYYDRAAWAQPQGVVFGNTGRNQFRGPGGVNLDMSVFRSFPIRGTSRLEFRAEANNLTNTPKFGNPNGDVNSGSFMQINGSLGGYAERQVRLGLRFSF